MKTTLKQTSSRLLLQALSKPGQLVLALCLASAMNSQAQTSIIKANSFTSLTTGSDWVGSTAPAASNIAVWNSIVTSADSEALGANTTWDGIQILNPVGPVTITADGNALTNGAGGINLMAASQSLTMSNILVLNGPQYWQVGNNQTLSFQGSFQRPLGGAILFSFDNSSAAAYVLTNGTTIYGNNEAFLDGTPGVGTSTGVPIATYNDVDFAGINQNNQIVSLATFGYSTDFGSTPIYLGNPNGPTPTFANGTSALFYDFTNTTSYGARVSTTTYVTGMRFNVQQTTNAYTYNGLDAWQMTVKSGSVLDLNSALMTTNDGISPVAFTGAGGEVRLSTASGAQDMTIFQNDPAANMIFQIPVVGRAVGQSISKYGVGTVEAQAGFTYSAGTLIYGGTVMPDVGGSLGVGQVTVNSGGNFEGASSAAVSTAPVVVNSGGAYGVYIVAANGLFNNNTNITFGAGTTALQFIYTNTVAPSTTQAPLVETNSASSVALNGTVNVNVLCSTLSVGQYPLVKYAGTLGGSGFAALNLNQLPPNVSGYLSNNTANSSIDLVITNDLDPIVWSAGSGIWDVGQTANWTNAIGASTTYQRSSGYQLAGPLGDDVVFNDTASGPSVAVTLNTNVSPGNVTFINTANNYTISGTGSIYGGGSLTKTGTGTVTLATTNSFSGGVNLNGGTVIFSTLNNLGSPNSVGADPINFNGGTLQYNGNIDDISVRPVYLNSGGATINTAGQGVNYANPIGSGGLGGLTKAGSGMLILNGINTYHGNTVISQGTLETGTNTDLTNSAVIIVNSSTVFDTTSNNDILVLSAPASQTLEGSGQINGVVTTPTSTTIGPSGGNGSTHTLAINGGLIVSGGSLDMDVAATSNDVIAVTGLLTLSSGTLQLNVNGTLPFGRYPLITYTGAISGSPVNLNITGFNQVGAIATLDNSVAGQIALVVSVGASDNLTWSGTASPWNLSGALDWLKGSTPWAYTNGDNVTFNDSASGGFTTISLGGTLLPGTIIVSNTVIPYYQLANSGGAIEGGTATTLVKDGTGTLEMDTPNLYTGTTTIKNGTLQIGNASSVGDIGQGNITNNGALIFAQGDGATHLVHGVVSGTGSLLVNATATIVLTNNNTYSGLTTISNGTLQVGNGLAAGSLGTALNILNNGSLLFDRAGTFTNSNIVTGSGSLGTDGGGTATLTGSLTYQGDTLISGGTLKLNANNQLPSTNSVAGSIGLLNLSGGATTNGVLDLNGFNLTVNGLVASNTLNGTITNSSTSTSTTNTLLDLGVTSLTYDGLITDHGATGAKTVLFVAGTNVLTLDPTSPSTFTGGIIISNSTVELGTVSDTAAATNAPGAGPITLLGTNATLVLAGGQLSAGNSVTYSTETNTMIVPAGQTGNFFGPPRGNVGGALLGSGLVNWNTSYVRENISGIWSAFTGTVSLAGNSTGGNLGFTLTNGLPNATLTINTNVTLYCNVAGGVFPIGALSGGDSSSTIEGTSSGNGGGESATFEIGALNASTTYGGGITDAVSVLKVGTGTLTLNNGGVVLTNIVEEGLFDVTNVGFQAYMVNYYGTTTVSNGVLALAAPVNLNSNSAVTIAAPNAVLDASAMGYTTDIVDNADSSTNEILVTNSIFEVVSNQTFGGVGTLRGLLQADQGSTNNIGLPTGTLTVTGSASLSGAITMNLNNADSTGNSELAASSFTINPTATLMVTNSGPELTNGITYTLFNHGVTGFASLTLPSGYVWQTNLATSGSITLVSGGVVPVTINPNPTNMTYSVSGGNLTLSWPSDHTGWTLQAQTNSTANGLSNNWYTVTGSTATNQVVLPIVPANGDVFYRLTY